MARTLIGVVTSDKPDKSIVVTVTTHKTHPLYKKRYISSKKFMAHDEKNEAQAGDKVSIIEVRPLSAKKRFSLSKIIERPMLREGIAGDVEVIAAKETKPLDEPKKPKNTEEDKKEQVSKEKNTTKKDEK